jgi:uncharacterized membrane protein YjdF
MLLAKRELPILVVNLIYVPIFTVVALRRTNYEFLLYVCVILIVAAWILWKQRRIRFDRTILWGLTIWGLLHMAGGNLRVGGGVLYGLVLVPLIERFDILRYDQFVHTFGFAVATLVCHHLLRPYLKDRIERWGTLAFLVVLMGSGFGALNEIIEFIAVLAVPETGVGGYENTLLDLVFNLIGGILAIAWLGVRRISDDRASTVSS